MATATEIQMSHPQKLRMVHRELVKNVPLPHPIRMQRCIDEMESRIDVELEALYPSFYHHKQWCLNNYTQLPPDDLLFEVFLNMYFTDSFGHGEYSFGRTKWSRVLNNALILKYAEKLEERRLAQLVQNTLELIKYRQANVPVYFD